MNINDFYSMKRQGKKITLVTCYDYCSAKIIAESAIDCVLVGDSVAMVMHGHATTLAATVNLMVLHTAAVARGAGNKFIVADMPFLSYRKNLTKTMNAVEKLMRAGAHAIKLERAEGNEKIIKHIVDSGVPVMGHLGMTPQSVQQLGGFRVQGKEKAAAQKILEQALQLQQAGCYSVVLECIPASVAQMITGELSIPTIGIGAGKNVDGQVLVWHDLLGMNAEFKPKFLKVYLDGFNTIKNALNTYDKNVKEEFFPSEEHCY